MAIIVPLGCATATPATGPDGRTLDLDQASAESARVTVDVKAALVRELDADAAAIDASLEGEAVRLSGFVSDEAQRTRVLGIARGAVPEREIIDALEVR